MLSDEEYREIWQTSLARCHPMNDISVAGIRTAKTAFALGVERAHKVKPLVWYPNGSGAYFWALGELYIVRALTNGEYSASYAGIDDLDGDFQTEHEAKTACQKHHEAFVLSQLEQV